MTFASDAVDGYLHLGPDIGGFLEHNRADAGFESAIDLDSTTPGVQSLLVNDIQHLNVYAPDGNSLTASFMNIAAPITTNVANLDYWHDAPSFPDTDIIITDGHLSASVAGTSVGSLDFTGTLGINVTTAAGDNLLDASGLTSHVNVYLNDYTGSNIFRGGPGDDFLSGRGTFDGGDGFDTGNFYDDRDMVLNDAGLTVEGTSYEWTSIERAVIGVSSISTTGRTVDASGFTRGPVNIEGASGNDILRGGGGGYYNQIFAYQGDDQVFVGTNPGYYDGGDGNDTLHLTTAPGDSIGLYPDFFIVNGDWDNYRRMYNLEHLVIDASGGPLDLWGHADPGYSVTIEHLPPQVDIGNNVFITDPAFAGKGGFYDARDSGWTATVDYGEGVGEESLAYLAWSSGGGTFNLQHTYAAPGRYEVTVRVSDPEGNVGCSTVQVRYLANEAPVVNTGGPYVTVEGGGVLLDASASIDPDGDELSFAWDIDRDGGFEELTGPQVALDWAALNALGMTDSGSFPDAFAVQVTDNYGGVSVGTVGLTINNVPPWVVIHNVTLGDEGALDPTIGDGGRVVTDFPSPGYAQGTDVVLQPDGKVVVVGPSYVEENGFGLVRFNTDGSLDSSFGDRGRVFIPVNSQRTSVALQSDGKIVVAGSGSSPGGFYGFHVGRFNSDGSPDDTFGVGGRVFTHLGGDQWSDDYGKAVTVDGEGRILVSGSTYHYVEAGDHYDTDLAVVRYDASGNLDATFGNGGIVILDLDGDPYNSSFDEANAVSVTPTGKILLAGVTVMPGSSDFAVLRLTDQGELDGTFGVAGTGIVTIDFGTPENPTSDNAAGMTRDGDGRIVLVGTVSGGETGRRVFGAARLTAEGELDPTFGDGGRATFDLGTVDVPTSNSGADVAVTDAGIILAGTRDIYDLDSNTAGDFAAIRLTDAGVLDASFGSDGVALVDFGRPGEAARAMAVRPDGRVVLAGYSAGAYWDEGSNYAVAQLSSSGVLDAGFSGDGRVTTSCPRFGYGDDRAVALLRQPDNKLVAVGSRYDDSSELYGIALARYNPDGSLDTTFGDDGRSFVSGTLDDYSYSDISDAALLPDGRILAVGSIWTSLGGEFGLARFNTDGSIDTTFGDNGLLLTNLNEGYEEAKAVAVQPDGKVVVAGFSYNYVSNDYDLAVVRYDTDFNLDPTFDEDGILILDLDNIPGNVSYDAARDLTVQPDGRIVIYALAGLNGRNYQPAVLRLNDNGTFDGSFGVGGIAVIDIGGTSVYPWSDANGGVALQPDGRVVVGDSFNDDGNDYDMFVARLTPEGLPDAAFDGDGVARIDFSRGEFLSSEYVNDVLVTAHGIVLAGTNGLYNLRTSENSTDFGVVRLTPEGAIDTTFAAGGVTAIDFGASDDYGRAIVELPDGKLVIAGDTVVPGSEYRDFALARLDVQRTGLEGSPIEFSSAAGDISIPDTTAGFTYHWTVTDEDDTVVETVDDAGFTFTPPDDGIFEVTLEAIDKDGGVGLATRSVTIENVAPVITSLRVEPVGGVDENGTVTLSGTFTDPGVADTHTVTVEWGDGNTDTLYDVPSGVPLSGTHQYLNNRPADAPYSISVTVTDNDGGTDMASAEAVVRNVSPTAEAGPDWKVRVGESVSLHGTWTDPGTLDNHTCGWVIVDNATGDVIGTSDGVDGTFTPAAAGTYTATFRTTDDDGGSHEDATLIKASSTLVTTHYVAVGADAGAKSHVRVYDADTGAEKFSFYAYGEFGGGVRTALGDVTGDGIPDIITGTGPGAGPHVKVFDGATGAEIRSFYAFAPNFGGGIYVASGDVDGDGYDDIIVGAGSGACPHVMVFSGYDGSAIHSFFAYGETFPGGVRVAAGDFTGDGKAEIVTGAGPGAGPHVMVREAMSLAVLDSFYAFAPSFAGGVTVAVGDVTGDGVPDLIIGSDNNPWSHIRVLDGVTGTERASFMAHDTTEPPMPGYSGGVRVAAVDVTGDGRAEVIVASAPGRPPLVKVFDALTAKELDDFFAFDPVFRGGLFVAGR